MSSGDAEETAAVLSFERFVDSAQFGSDHLPAELRGAATVRPAELVGFESDGKLLFARDVAGANHRAHTIIELWDPDPRHPRLSCVFCDPDGVSVVVSASINDRRTVLAFTKAEHQSATSSEVYECIVVEIERVQRQRYEVTQKSGNFQKLQFLPSDSNGRTARFLYVVARERIELYTIDLCQVVHDDRKVTAIASSPHLQTPFCRQFSWYHWDPQHQLLFILQQKGDESMLTRIHLPAKRTKISLPIALPQRFALRPLTSRWCAAQRRLRNVITPVIVEETLNLCVQKVPEAGASSVDMIVLSVGNQQYCEFTIDLSLGHRPGVVLCASIADMLVLLIPGDWVLFLDCGAVDECRAIAQFVTGIPQVAGKRDRAFPVTPILHRNRGQIVVDSETSLVLTLEMVESALLASALHQMAADVPHFLYIAIVKLHNLKLAYAIIRALFVRSPQHVTSDLLREALVAGSYELMRSGKHDARLLRLVPSSYAAPITKAAKWKPFPQRNSSAAAGGVRRYVHRRSTSVGSAAALQPPSGAACSVRGSPVTLASSGIEGWSPLKAFVSLFSTKRPSFDRGSYEDSFVRHVLSVYPKESANTVNGLARALRDAQRTTAERLLDELLTFTEDSDLSKLQVLLSFYSAVLELQYETPANFGLELLKTTLATMSPATAWAMIDSCVVPVSDSMILHTLEASPELQRPENAELRLNLISRLSTREAALRELHKLPVCADERLEATLGALSGALGDQLERGGDDAIVAPASISPYALPVEMLSRTLVGLTEHRDAAVASAAADAATLFLEMRKDRALRLSEERARQAAARESGAVPPVFSGSGW